MSWAYCAPKSTTRTVSGAAAVGVADDTGCLPAVGRGSVVTDSNGVPRTTMCRGILTPCSRTRPSSLPMATGPPAAMVVLLEQLTSDFPGAPGRLGPGRLAFADPADPGHLRENPTRS